MATPDSLDKETGLFGIGEQRSAVVNDTILHIPYCTGDVHAGEKFRCADVTVFALCHSSNVASSRRYRLLATGTVFVPFLAEFSHSVEM
jgi:hypothetical protein